MLLNIRQCTGESPQQRIIPREISIVSRLRNRDPDGLMVHSFTSFRFRSALLI